MTETTQQALDKLDREWSDCGSVGGAKAAVNAPIYHTLRGFCMADAEFAALIAASDMTLKGCLEKVHKDVQSGWSDYQVFSRAVSAYVPGARIRVMMEIDLNGDIDFGVAFGRDGKATEKVYRDKPAAGKSDSKPKKSENPKKTAKTLPPPNVSGQDKPATQAKIIRFNLLDTL